MFIVRLGSKWIVPQSLSSEHMSYSIFTLFRSCYGLSRLWEFQSVTLREYPQIEIDWQWDETCYRYHGGDYGPSIIQPLSNDLSIEQWANIGAQCIGNKAVFQILGEGRRLQDCIASVGRLTDDDILQLVPDTWSIKIKHLGKMKGSQPNQTIAQIEQFQDVLNALTLRQVDLENPNSELWLLKDCRRLEDSHTSSKPPEIHYHWLLKLIKPTTTIKAQQLVKQSDIKKRAFIGTTTMPSDRALLMANLANFRKGDVVLDPFCGSAGLLLASSLLGAKVVGGDVDVELLSHHNQPLSYPPSSKRPLRGIENVSFGDSFIELGLAEPTLLVGADIQDPHMVEMYLKANHGQTYAAIITDPPYGIRESRSNMGSFELLARLCEVAEGLLRNRGRVVLLQLVKGRFEQINVIRDDLILNIKKTIQPYQIELHTLSLERFNTRCLRATIVLLKKGFSS